VQDAGADKAQVYPLLGDRYLLGRSSKSCDIVVRNPVVSQIHLSVSRDSRSAAITLRNQDESSTNGIYRGKRRVTALELHHGDILTLTRTCLCQASIPPWYVQAASGAPTASGSYCTNGIRYWHRVAQIFGVAVALPLSRVIVYSRDGQTPLSATHYGSRRYEAVIRLFPYLPDAVVASEDSRFTGTLGLTRWHFTSRGGKCAGGFQEGASTVTSCA